MASELLTDEVEPEGKIPIEGNLGRRGNLPKESCTDTRYPQCARAFRDATGQDYELASTVPGYWKEKIRPSTAILTTRVLLAGRTARDRVFPIMKAHNRRRASLQIYRVRAALDRLLTRVEFRLVGMRRWSAEKPYARSLLGQQSFQALIRGRLKICAGKYRYRQAPFLQVDGRFNEYSCRSSNRLIQISACRSYGGNWIERIVSSS